MVAVQSWSSEVHIVVVPLANLMSSRHIPATVTAPAGGVNPTKYPSRM